jgi:hypothetical protein
MASNHPVATSGFLEPIVEVSSNSSNPISEQTASNSFCFDGLDLGCLLADHLLFESDDVEALNGQQLASRQAFRGTHVRSSSTGQQTALGRTGQASDVRSTSSGQHTGHLFSEDTLVQLADVLHSSSLTLHELELIADDVFVQPPQDLAQYALDGASSSKRPQSPADTSNILPNTDQAPKSDLHLSSPYLPITINSSPESIAAADKKDRHSKTKICCYMLVIFIPMAILVLIAAVIAFLLQPAEGWYDSCWNATKTTDTHLTCKKLLEDYCFNQTVLDDLQRCEDAGYYLNGTVTHDWERSG